MTRFRVANSQALGSVRSGARAFGWSLRYALLVCAVLGGFVPRSSAQSAATTVILISVMDEDRHALAGVTIEGRSGSALLCKAVTDAHGLATLTDCGPSPALRLPPTLPVCVPVHT